MSQSKCFFLENERIATKSAKFIVSGVSFFQSRCCSLHCASDLASAPLGASSAQHRLEKQAGTLKETRVWKRKTRMRCRGNVSVKHSELLLSRPSPGGWSTRGFISPPLLSLSFWVQCDTPRCPRLIMRSGTDCALMMAAFIDIFIRVGHQNAEGGRIFLSEVI